MFLGNSRLQKAKCLGDLVRFLSRNLNQSLFIKPLLGNESSFSGFFGVFVMNTLSIVWHPSATETKIIILLSIIVASLLYGMLFIGVFQGIEAYSRVESTLFGLVPCLAMTVSQFWPKIPFYMTLVIGWLANATLCLFYPFQWIMYWEVMLMSFYLILGLVLIFFLTASINFISRLKEN